MSKPKLFGSKKTPIWSGPPGFPSPHGSFLSTKKLGSHFETQKLITFVAILILIDSYKSNTHEPHPHLENWPGFAPPSFFQAKDLLALRLEAAGCNFHEVWRPKSIWWAIQGWKPPRIRMVHNSITVFQLVKPMVCMLFLSHYVYTMLFSRWSTFGFCIVARQMRKRCGEWRWRPWTSCPTSNCRCQGDGSFSKGEDVTKCCCTQVHQRVDSVQLRLSWIWSCSFPQRSCCMLVADRHLRYSKDEGLFHELHVKPSSTLVFEKVQQVFFSKVCSVCCLQFSLSNLICFAYFPKNLRHSWTLSEWL